MCANTHGTFSCAGDSLVVVCSQPKRGALRRQACIDQHQDPWVRHSRTSPDELPKAKHRPVGSPRPENIMTESEKLPQLNDTSDPAESLSDGTPSEGAKKGPPVAPKPPWFRQSLRKILDERERKKPDKPAARRPHMDFSRSFAGRSDSSAANLSIKQKIHSFETFSGPAGSEMPDNRKPASVSSSSPPVHPEPRSHSGNANDRKDEVLEEILANPSPSVSIINPSTSEDQPQRSQEQPMSNQEPRGLRVEDLDSGSNDAVSSLDHDVRNASPSEQESETEGSVVLPIANSPPEDIEMDEALTAKQPQKDLDGENLEKILTLSTQVI